MRLWKPWPARGNPSSFFPTTAKQHFNPSAKLRATRASCLAPRADVAAGTPQNERHGRMTDPRDESIGVEEDAVGFPDTLCHANAHQRHALGTVDRDRA